MTGLKARLAIAAATLALVATAAPAQELALKASIPFPFTSGTAKVMPAGDYLVLTSGNVWRVMNREERTSAFIWGGTRGDMKATGQPKLVFECRTHGCALRQVDTGAGSGIELHGPRPNKSDANELARVVIVPLASSAE